MRFECAALCFLATLCFKFGGQIALSARSCGGLSISVRHLNLYVNRRYMRPGPCQSVCRCPRRFLEAHTQTETETPASPSSLPPLSLSPPLSILSPSLLSPSCLQKGKETETEKGKGEGEEDGERTERGGRERSERRGRGEKERRELQASSLSVYLSCLLLHRVKLRVPPREGGQLPR